MDRTVVLVRSRLAKFEREFVACAENRRFESFVGACDRVLNVVPIHPRYCRSRRHRDVLRHEAEEIDQDFDLLRSHLPLPLVVLHIIDFLAYTLGVSFTHFLRSESGRFELASLYQSLFLESYSRPPLDVLLSRPPSRLSYSKIIRFFVSSPACHKGA
jgi:hypothetical protein